MAKLKKTDLKQEVILIVAGLIILILIVAYNLITLAFTGPTAPPTGGAGSLEVEADEDLVFDPGGTKKFGINVSPTQALDVGGNVNISGTYQVNGVPISVSSNGWNDSGTAVYLETGGDLVGIGTNNPSKKLDVATPLNDPNLNLSADLILKKNTNTVQTGNPLGIIYFGANDGGSESSPQIGASIAARSDEFWQVGQSGSELVFSTVPINSNSTLERMIIDNNGDIVLVSSGSASNINFNNSANNLDGQIKYDSSIDKLGLYTNIAGGATNPAIVIDNAHNVGIGIDPPTARLDVAVGDIKTTRGGIVTGTLWTPIPLVEPSNRNTQTSSYIGQFTSTDTVNVPNVTQCVYDAPTRTCSYPIPTVPASAKEIFVYYNLMTDSNTTGGIFANKLDYKIFTRDGALDYATYVNVNDMTNDRGYTHGTAWLPLTSDNRLRVTRIYAGSPAFVFSNSDANAIHIIGYR